MTGLFTPRSGRSGRQVLQRAVYDPPLGADSLGLRRVGAGSFPTVYSTDTYFNVFHQSRWRRLTGLTDFALEASGPATGVMRLFSAAEASGPPVPRGEARLDAQTPQACLPLTVDGDFFFFEWRPDDGVTLLPTCEYTAEAPSEPVADPGIALVITTFNREADIRRTVATYARARREFAEIRELTVLYVVNNQISDAEKLADLRAEGVILINNLRNTGGAGGFSLGAKEAVSAGWATHTLFMDDDIVIHPESWLRTLALVRNLKPAYADHVVSGGMFCRERPAYCHTLFEGFDRNAGHHILSGRRELTEWSDIRESLGRLDRGLILSEAETNSVNPSWRPYAGWWFCLIPVRLFRQYGYPLPFFFRGDDQEFSLRVGSRVLALNGICVWHPDFESLGRRDLPRIYLKMRGQSVYTTLYFQNWRWLIARWFFIKFNRALAANDYELAAVILAGFADYQTFHRHQGDGPEIFAGIEKARAAFPNTVIAPGELGRPMVRSGILRGGGCIALLPVILTLGGGLLPVGLFRRTPIQAALVQVRGKFPSRYVAQTHDPSVKVFNRLHAVRLSVMGLYALVIFLMAGRRVAERLQSFLASPYVQKGEWL